MFGFGSFGNTASGVSANYARMFVDVSGDRRLVTTHNSMLQFLFDGGWAITIVFAATVCYMAWVLSRRSSIMDLSGLATLTALSIVSATEVALSPSHAYPTWWVLMAVGMIAFSREPSSPAQTETKEPTGGEPRKPDHDTDSRLDGAARHRESALSSFIPQYPRE
jgi:hypothetical protein